MLFLISDSTHIFEYRNLALGLGLVDITNLDYAKLKTSQTARARLTSDATLATFSPVSWFKTILEEEDITSSSSEEGGGVSILKFSCNIFVSKYAVCMEA